MKKIHVAIFALSLLLASLMYAAVETKVSADPITCGSLTGCCGAAACQGPGTVSGCSISCQGGGTASCCSNASGKCDCGLPPKTPPPRPN